MPVDGRDDRVGELEPQLVGVDTVLAGLKENATPEQLQDMLDRLREVLHRAKQRQLEPDDWPLLNVLLREEMRRRMT